MHDVGTSTHGDAAAPAARGITHLGMQTNSYHFVPSLWFSCHTYLGVSKLLRQYCTGQTA
jgi:hypothetical protein